MSTVSQLLILWPPSMKLSDHSEAYQCLKEKLNS